MKTKNTYAVYFSPNGNTKEVAMRLVSMISNDISQIDFTSPEARTKVYSFAPGDLVIFACPTYAGKLPNKLLPFIKESFAGSGAFAVPIVTFGNRSFDNSLAELTAVLSDSGLQVAAAGAFVTKHAFSDTLGAGRPDSEDLDLMHQLASHIKEKLSAISESAELLSPTAVPGDPDAPYYTPLGTDGAPAVFLKAKPKTNPDLCDSCGVCAKKCPMGSISFDDFTDVPGICIKCHACVNSCHTGAKYFDDPSFLSHKAMLENTYTRRAPSMIFW